MPSLFVSAAISHQPSTMNHHRQNTLSKCVENFFTSGIYAPERPLAKISVATIQVLIESR
jgi:hypothetical protein